MDVIVSPLVPTSTHVRSVQLALSEALKHNSLWLAVDDEPWELIALIVPGRTNAELFVDFALRAEKDRRLRACVGATPDGQPVAVEAILASTANDYLDPELFLGIAERAADLAGEAQHFPNPNTLH